VNRFNPQAVNYMDAARAIPNKQADVIKEIVNVGQVNTIAEAILGMHVGKSGRTTKDTEGVITGLHATMKVNYGSGKVATMENQIISTAMSAGGDSGSLLFEVGTYFAVGLLFAGSNQITIYSPIQRVLDALHVTL
jgi:hypothetical protein